MPPNSLHIVIGGEAGQGLVTIGALMTKALVRSGFAVVVTQDYLSRIRGGHNTYRICVAGQPIHAGAEEIDILVALNAETVAMHADALSDRAVVIMAEADGEAADEHNVKRAMKVPFKDLSPKPLYANTVALGVLASVLELDAQVLEGLMRDTFGKKGDEVVDANIDVLTKAREWKEAQERHFHMDISPCFADEERMTISGNEAIALGAMAAGCNFCSFYPMTPATSIVLNLIARAEKLGIVAEQAEDEIAAINMALGASFAGARALTATSGGGFALMTEGVSLAGITETPIVVALAQRPGPATGLPTRTEQGDLNLVLYAGHGEFPRAIYAPGSPEQCFHTTITAFDMAEKYQSPVFILTDQYLADSARSVAPFDMDALPEVAAPLTTVDDPGSYERYAYTDSGVSPRLVPGFTEGLVLVDSDEHTPDGHITEDHGVRNKMMHKRMAKHDGLASEVQPPDYDGPDSPATLLVCWGSSLGPVAEAAERLREDGKEVGVLHFTQLWPLVPEQFIARLLGSGDVVFVEANYTGQFARLVRQETGFAATREVHRYDGLPFTPDYILRELANDNANGNEGGDHA